MLGPMEPSDYYPDAFYRDPPEDPRSQEMPGRAVDEIAWPEAPRLIRHEGRGEHFHVRRTEQRPAHRPNSWGA